MTWDKQDAVQPVWDRQAPAFGPWAVLDPNARVTQWDTLLGGTAWDTSLGGTIWDLSLVDDDIWTKQ